MDPWTGMQSRGEESNRMEKNFKGEDRKVNKSEGFFFFTTRQQQNLISQAPGSQQGGLGFQWPRI